MRLAPALALLGGIVVTGMAALPPPAGASTVEEFYKGRTLSLYVGYGAGAAYDAYARLIAPYLAKNLPGQPTLVVRNMPGGSSMKAANYLYNVAARDGSSIGVIRNGLVFEPLYGGAGAKFDALKFNWIGSVSRITGICAVWHTAPVQSVEAAKQQEVIVGATGATGSTAVFPRALNAILGTKFKPVTGYKASDLLLAIERGELHGRCGGGWDDISSRRPDWVAEGKIRVIAQMSNSKHPDLAAVPLIFDYVTNPDDAAALRLIFASQDWGRPVVAPPAIPADRLAALRAAFDRAVADPGLAADAARLKLELVGPIGGAALQEMISGYYATPAAVIERAKSF